MVTYLELSENSANPISLRIFIGLLLAALMGIATTVYNVWKKWDPK